MHLELHDNEEGNTLNGGVKDIDYDYQAEEWVRLTIDQPEIIKWILYDGSGIRCVWERPEGSTSMPDITQRSERFTGTWEKGPVEVSI
ncbi:MAG: hypothetical protein AAB632_02340 [Patescibacteria group bacterium]